MIVFNDIKVKASKLNETEGSFEISPLPRGYGNTLANALRRILLSSIPGAGITSVKIKGVDHEYSAVEGMKEDVLEVILNLKGLVFNMSSDEPQVCILKTKGDKVVTGKEIQLTGNVTLVNPEHEIATLTAADSELEIEIVVEKGVGYREADDSIRSEIGKLPVDTDFSPIKKVSFEVISARKGQQTDLDGIEVQIVTDGSVDPKQVLVDSAKILQDFAGKVMVAMGMSQVEVEQMAEESLVIESYADGKDGLDDEVSKWKVEDLPISKRSKSGLIAGGFMTVGDVAKTSKAELIGLQGFGNKSLNEVVELMRQYGIEIK